MKTELYPHKVAAVYPDNTAAEAAAVALHAAALDNVRLVRLAPGASDIDLAIEPEREETRNTVAKDVMTGGAAGTAVGAAVAGAAAVAAPTLFVSTPVVGPMIVLGYGTMIGGAAGAVRGLKLRENVLSGVVKDALKAGYHVVIVHAANEESQQRAQAVIAETIAEETAQT